MGLKEALAKWLGIKPAESQVSIEIRENTTRELTVLKNTLWYRGDPVELEQFYKQAAEMSLGGMSLSPTTRFWASENEGVLIRKLHSGLPRLIADKIAAIVVNDMQEPDLDGGSLQRWAEIAEDIEFPELLKKSVTKVLSEGDGAFKVCVDTEVSKLPLVEFVGGNKVEYVYNRGKLQEIQFKTEYYKNTRRYELVEYYGKGYVNYKLFDSNNHEVDLAILEETEELVDITFEGEFIMAVPIKFYDSAKFDYRGESIFETKGDSFDSLDEVLSTWMDGVRAGRVKQYIPEDLVPRSEMDGTLMKPDVFNPFFLKSRDMSEMAENKIDVVQGDVKFDGLLASYITWLDVCLQGLISPSTLGIDVKKLDNAESQREKEKATLYTRDTIIGVLSKVLPKLVDTILKTQDTMSKAAPGVYEASFEWGQYANPAFEAMVETIGKAKQYGIMSLEQCVEELYGDMMDQKDKDEEVARIKGEATVALDVPSINNEFTKSDTESADKKKPGMGDLNGSEL